MKYKTDRIYNEMGDGYDDWLVLCDDDGSRAHIYHIGRFYEGWHSLVNSSLITPQRYMPPKKFKLSKLARKGRVKAWKVYRKISKLLFGMSL